MKTKILPFTTEMLHEAGRLLAESHKCHCAQVELLPKRFENQKVAYLSVAATKPQARGRGVNTVLTWHGLRHARQEGYEICYTNWIGPNLLASRFWPRFGFRDVAYRLAKKVNPMIAWAKDE